MSDNRPPFRLREWLVEPALHRVRRDDDEQHLEPLVMAVLVHLAARRGDVVSKVELLREVWGGAFVEEGAVARAISELRRALGDDAAHPSFIETIPKGGYRLIAPVEEVLATGLTEPVESAEASTARAHPGHRQVRHAALLLAGLGLALVAGSALYLRRQRAAPDPHVSPMSSVAVLPLRNLSGNPQQQYFADGMTEALITDLSHIRALRVVAGVSTTKLARSPLPEVASKLGVDGLVEGAVARSGDVVQLTLRLVEPTGTVRWSRRYTARLSNALALQGDVARDVAAEIQVAVRPHEAARLARRRPVDSDAYVAYLQARMEWSSRSIEGFEAARRHFAVALARDPDFAPAHAGLAICRAIQANRQLAPAAEAYAEVRREAERALALDPDLAEAHAALALVQVGYERQPEAAHESLQRAIELEPSNATYHLWLGQLSIAEADLVTAIRELELTLRLDPLFGPALNTLAHYTRYAGRDAEALRLERAYASLRGENRPHSIPHYHTPLTGGLDDFEGLVREAKGDEPGAIAAFARDLEVEGQADVARQLRQDFANHGFAIAIRNREQRDLAWLRVRQQQMGDVPALAFAQSYVNAGDVEGSLEWLERLRREGMADFQDYLANIAFDPLPRLAPLKEDPRFDRLLRASGMPSMESFRMSLDRARSS